MQISTIELRRLVDQVDDQHREAMRTVHEDLHELHFGETARTLGLTRRRFLADSGAGGAVLAVGAALAPMSRFMPAAVGQGLTDVDLARFAESVERAAVEAYMAAAGSGKLDPAVVSVGTLFAGHHDEHAAAFAGILGDSAVNAPNQAILGAFGPMIEGAPDQAAVLEIALQIEEAAASTYLFALGALQDPGSAAAVATILPVESQHAVVLGTALGKDVGQFMPSFETTQHALDPAEFPIEG